MAIKNIQQGADNEILREKSIPIKKFDQKIKQLAKDLKDTLKKNPGVGLAAPQIGENLRMVLVKLNAGTSREIEIIMANPEIVSLSTEQEKCEEGCLSFPGLYLEISRSKEIVVKFADMKGNFQTLSLKNLNARVVQHEIDHLNGILIIDK